MALRVKEIYSTIQGEGYWAGYPFTLVRLSGCNLRCKYCDSTYAFKGGRRMLPATVAEAVWQRGIPRVLVTGGEPLIQAEAPELLQSLLAAGFMVSMETNGSLDLDRVPKEVHIVMDLKTPGSGEVDANKPENIQLLKSTDEIKFVLTDKRDYNWSRGLIRQRKLEKRFRVVLSPAFGLLEPAALAEWMIRDKLNARLGMQLHKIIFSRGREQDVERIL